MMKDKYKESDRQKKQMGKRKGKLNEKNNLRLQKGKTLHQTVTVWSFFFFNTSINTVSPFPFKAIIKFFHSAYMLHQITINHMQAAHFKP